MGLTIALALKRRHADAGVHLIEKEPAFGLHASGRNSGVLHAGFYYSADSLKARFTRDGNRLLTEYCLERGLPINRCGKLVVARNEADLPGLDELLRRAKINGVELQPVDEAEARTIEPRVKTCGRALFSPTTSSVDPAAVVAALQADAEQAGIGLHAGTAYRSRAGRRIRTGTGEVEARYVVNCAGLYADRIARQFGFCRRYTILPFKGLYLYSAEPPGAYRTHIYPVPDLEHPFLGVHFTLTADGRAKIGPTAIPAFWREHYRGLANFRLDECLSILGLEAGLLLHNRFGFARLALEEMQKYRRGRMVGIAAQLAEVPPASFRHWGKPGIRAQLIDLEARRLEMDFRYEADEHSFHLLNAVSPAFTCSLSLSEFIADDIAARLG